MSMIGNLCDKDSGLIGYVKNSDLIKLIFHVGQSMKGRKTKPASIYYEGLL